LCEFSDLKKLTDDSGYLLQNKVHSWLECIVVKALDSFKKLYPLFQITHTKSGPAHTLNVNGKFFIDLAAGFVFKSDHHWISDRKKPPLISSWLAIPRPYKENTANNNQNWIPAYAMLEKEKIHNKNTFKNAIRLIKKLRDNLNLCNLKSYFIKTVFLWELDRRPANYWEQSLTQIFLDCFDAIIDCIEKREIKFYWDANYNMLLASLTVNQVDDLGIRLKIARNVILQNKDTPENFVNQFCKFIFSFSFEILKYNFVIIIFSNRRRTRTIQARVCISFDCKIVEKIKTLLIIFSVRFKNDDLVSSMTNLMISGFNSSTTQDTLNNQLLPYKDESHLD